MLQLVEMVLERASRSEGGKESTGGLSQERAGTSRIPQARRATCPSATCNYYFFAGRLPGLASPRWRVERWEDQKRMEKSRNACWTCWSREEGQAGRREGSARWQTDKTTTTTTTAAAALSPHDFSSVRLKPPSGSALSAFCNASSCQLRFTLPGSSINSDASPAR